MTKLLLATNNQGKLREFKKLFESINVECCLLSDFNHIEEVEETGKTFEENAALKALGYASQTGLLTLGEDSGLCCEALDDAPGVYSARFSGDGKSDEANNQKLLRLLKGIPVNCRGAYYVSCISLARPNQLLGTVRGEVRGVISEELRGSEGFGYDPLFYYPPFSKTFGEVSSEMKHDVSHRAGALKKFKILLEECLKEGGIE